MSGRLKEGVLIGTGLIWGLFVGILVMKADPNSILPLALMTVCPFLGAWVLTRIFGSLSWGIALAVGIGLPLVDGWTIYSDGLKNPTSHNLWPIELAMIIAFAGGSACLGAFFASPREKTK